MAQMVVASRVARTVSSFLMLFKDFFLAEGPMINLEEIEAIFFENDKFFFSIHFGVVDEITVRVVKRVDVSE